MNPLLIVLGLAGVAAGIFFITQGDGVAAAPAPGPQPPPTNGGPPTPTTGPILTAIDDLEIF